MQQIALYTLYRFQITYSSFSGYISDFQHLFFNCHLGNPSVRVRKLKPEINDNRGYAFSEIYLALLEFKVIC